LTLPAFIRCPAPSAMGLPHQPVNGLTHVMTASIREFAGEPVSRVLSCGRSPKGPLPQGQPFLSATHCCAAQATNPGCLGQKQTRHSRWRAAPIRSCSGWGLPCRFRYRSRGALLPHPFTLAALPKKGLAVCSLWHFPSASRIEIHSPGGRYPPSLFRGARTFLDIASDDAAARLPGGRHLARPVSRSNKSSNRIPPISPSIRPSMISGRQRRWKAVTAARPSTISYPNRSSAR